MSTNKINSELSQIIAYDQETTYARRIEYANSRGKRIQFIDELNKRLDKEGVTGKRRSSMYSTAMVEYDKENMKMSWAA